MLAKCKKQIPVFLAGLCTLCIIGFRPDDQKEQNLRWIQECLSSSFNSIQAGAKLKKWELKVSPDGFFRLRKYYPNGKQEYFSFNLKKFSALGYLGSDKSGDIVITTLKDDIIIQTYNDPKGNIDSMGSIIKVPVLNIQAERLDSLNNYLNQQKVN